MQETAAEEQANSSPPAQNTPEPSLTPQFRKPLGPYKFAPEVGDNWEKCLKAVEKYDNDMCTSWKEEIDTLLVFVRPFLLSFSFRL
jgi:hypothetical protein